MSQVHNCLVTNGATDGGWTLDVGVRGVDRPVDGDGGGRVVGLDGLARCHGLGAMGFLNARGSVPALDFSMPGARCLRWTCASILDQRTGLARCHPGHSPPPPPPPLASDASPLHRDCWTGGAWPLIWLAATPLLLLRSRYLTAGSTHSPGRHPQLLRPSRGARQLVGAGWHIHIV